MMMFSCCVPFHKYRNTKNTSQQEKNTHTHETAGARAGGGGEFTIFARSIIFEYKTKIPYPDHTRRTHHHKQSSFSRSVVRHHNVVPPNHSARQPTTSRTTSRPSTRTPIPIGRPRWTAKRAATMPPQCVRPFTAARRQATRTISRSLAAAAEATIDAAASVRRKPRIERRDCTTITNKRHPDRRAHSNRNPRRSASSLRPTRSS